jgi:dimethylglycine dehydrogenase
LKSHVQVAVIGGGVVGCSVLYHLTKAGWKDVVLLEKAELTSGSTWHAAGGMHTINGDPNVAKLQKYTIDLYKEIEDISGQSCGVEVTGSVLLAGTEDRMDWLRLVHSRSKALGFETSLISVDEAYDLFPLIDKSCFIGALHDPLQGHVDPSGVTNAYAKAARLQGATIYRHTHVTETHQRPDGGWDIVTDKGTIRAEHVVNAGGLWAREVGRMAGLELPILAMEHQYLITEEIPEVLDFNRAQGKQMLHAIDFEGESYSRQEGRGMLIGTYERDGRPWAERTTPWDFVSELLPSDLERMAPSLEIGFKHFPALERAGIKKIINGPFTFAPDGNPLVGPVRGLRNYWVACGVMAGFSQGGGVGLTLANWITEGDPGADIWGMDVARFGDWTTMAYTKAKVQENYSRRFRIRFPNEELPAARPVRTTPVYARLKQAGAVFGAAYGLEYPLWFAPQGVEPVEDGTFRRSVAHPVIGDECRAVRQGVGVVEISNFGKYRVSGPDAESWLSHVLANRMPRIGRVSLSPMLNERGRLIGDMSVARLAADDFLLFGAGQAEEYHLRWFERQRGDNRVEVRSLRAGLVGLAIAGPRSRKLLARLTHDDVSNQAFPFMSFRRMEIGLVPAYVGRLSYTGELGYEFWVSPEYQLALLERLLGEGAGLGVRLFGTRALGSLRLEKGFGSWAREFRPTNDPYEAGLGRFVALDKGEFIGRAAAAKASAQPPARQLKVLRVPDTDADAIGDETILFDGKPIGMVTSGGFGHVCGQSIAMGYLPTSLVDKTEGFAIEILGRPRVAVPVAEALIDPTGARMRG